MRHVRSNDSLSASGVAIPAIFMLLFTVTSVPGLAQAPGQGDEHSKPVQLQILAINDLHGHIDSAFFNFNRWLGGVDYLATYLRFLEAQADNTIIVSAGDMVGASPLISALFHDEPTIEAANLLGVDLNVVGNHELDEGTAEVLRLQYGGCHPVDGCLDGDGFDGAEFTFLAANTVHRETGETLFPPVLIRNYQGVRVAFIGLTLEATPTIVDPAGIADWRFLDEAETINTIVPMLRQINIEAIVVVIHQGGFQVPGGQFECVGPIVDIVEHTDPAVDLFITGHTHQINTCIIDGRPVLSAWSFGRLFTQINVELNRVTKDMTVLSAFHWLNARNVPPEPDVTALIDKYDALVAPLANTVIGSITTDITGARTAAGESALGDVITDAQLAATSASGFGDADVAFTNSGGIRADLLYLSSGSEADGEVTYAEAFEVQPFGNSLVTMTLTGAQIDALLELQFDNPEPGSGDILQVSAGFEYAWSASAPTGSKVDPATIKISGVPIDLARNYRVTVASFLAAGGGIFGPVLLQGTDRLSGAIDVDALVDYFAVSSPVVPGPRDRITRLP